MKKTELNRRAARAARRTLAESKTEIETANRYMLMGVRFVFQILGIDPAGLLAKFVEQEFQSWVRTVENAPGRRRKAGND